MALKNRTKTLLAESFKEILLRTPVEKVRVTDICKRADVTTQVFYYHFKDKYDLASWIFIEDFSSSFGDEKYRAPITPDQHIDMMTQQFERMWEKRDLYRRMLSDKSQNSLQRSIHDFDIEISTTAMKAYLGYPTLSQELRYAASYTSHACLGMTIDWLTGRFEATPRELAQLQFDFMPPALRESFEALGCRVGQAADSWKAKQ